MALANILTQPLQVLLALQGLSGPALAVSASQQSITQSQLQEAEELYELIRQRTGRELPSITSSPNPKVRRALGVAHGAGRAHGVAQWRHNGTWEGRACVLDHMMSSDTSHQCRQHHATAIHPRAVA